MTNLKINGVPTPYWCVVVPIDYDAKLINEIDKLVFELLGCITLSSMDEWVREVVEGIEEYNGVWAWKDYAHESALSLLTHNQITLTADTKAVVIKNIS